MAFTFPPTLPLLSSSRPLCLSSPFLPVRNRVYCTEWQTPAPGPAPVPPQYNSLSDMDAKIRELLGMTNALRDRNDADAKRILHLMKENNKLSRSLERLIEEKLLHKYQLQVRGIFETFVSHACVGLDAAAISCEGDSLQQIVRYLPRFREGLKRCSGQQSQDDLVGLLRNVEEYVNTFHHPLVKLGGQYLISKEAMENEVYAKVIEYMAQEIGLDVKVVSMMIPFDLD